MDGVKNENKYINEKYKKKKKNYFYIYKEIHTERKRNTKTHFVHCQGRRSAECRVHIIIIIVKKKARLTQ